MLRPRLRLYPPTGAVRDIGGLDLEALLEFWRQHWHVQVRADNLLGPRLALHEVLAQLEVAQSVLATTTGSDWRRVAAWAATYAESASWLYENLADSAAARTWVHHARRWAQAAGDTTMVAWTNYRRSQHALSSGDADHALGLAQADPASLPPVMVAAFAVHHALCHATLGEERAALDRLDAAHQQRPHRRRR